MKTPINQLILLVILTFAVCVANSQTTEFTYQGNLSTGTPPVPTSVNHDFEFRLFSVNAGGSAIATVQRLNVPISSGSFSVKLDFGAQFPANTPRYIEIAVGPAGSGSFQTLSPRTQILSAPFSVRSKDAINADNLGGVAANQYLLTNGNGSGLTNLNAGNITTGTLAIANGGTGSATKIFVDLSTDQTGIGGNKTFTGDLAVIGNVGIGTNPNQKLTVSGAGGVRANVNSDLNAGLGLSLNNAPKWSVATVIPGQFQIFNDAIGQNAVWIDPANNNVGIGSATPAAKLEVNGYTKLGSDAPAIRVKKLTGTTPAGEGSEVLIPTGLDPEKIISISVMVRGNDPTTWVDANSPLVGHRYFWYSIFGDIRVITVTGGSAQILSKPIKILVTYEP